MSAEGARVKPNLSGKRIEYKLMTDVINCSFFAYFFFGVAFISNSFIFSFL